jgi:hypothetical protein
MENKPEKMPFATFDRRSDRSHFLPEPDFSKTVPKQG